MTKHWYWKRNCLIAVWLISIFVITAVYYSAEKRAAAVKVQKNLIEQANTAGGQIPSIFHNVLYSEIAMLKIQSAKLDAISFALKKIENNDEAGEMAEQIARIADVTDLTVYDDKGNLVYYTGDAPGGCVSFEAIRDLSYDYIKSVELMLEYPKLYLSHFLSSATYAGETEEADEEAAGGIYEEAAEDIYEEAAEDIYEEAAEESDDTLVTRIVNDGRWFMASRINKIMTEKEKTLLQRFDWRYVFREIKIGEDGFLAVFDNQDGTVLSFGQQDDMMSRSLEEMNVRIAEADHDASVSDLQEAFLAAGRIVKIRIGKKDYDAVRVDLDNTLILALQPLDTVYWNIINSLILRLLPLFVLTGVCVLFAVFRLQKDDGESRQSGKGFGWNKTIGNALLVFAVLAGTALFLTSLFLENLLKYADTYRFTSEKVLSAAEMYSNNQSALEDLENWSSEEYLTRCRIAGTILDPLKPEEISSAYLEELAGSLGIKYIYLFDANGKLVVTNSPYEHISINNSNPFHALLESRTEMSGQPEPDASSGKYLQRAGISLRNEDGKCSGLIMTEGYVEEIYEIANNLDYGHLFQQIGLTDGASVMVVNSSKDEIEYAAEVDKGVCRPGLESFNYNGQPISEAGLDAEKLYDHFNGSLSILHENFFASIRRAEDQFFIIMAPYPGIDRVCAVRAFVITLALLVFVILVGIISCLQKTVENRIPEEGENARSPYEGVQSGKDQETPQGDGKAGTVQRRSAGSSKEGFEERWSKDCIRWKDRTAEEKSRTSIKIIFILAFVLVIMNMGFAKENSVWQYIFSAERDRGLNLPSLSACLFSIAFLLVLKTVVHKLLFLTAKTQNRKTETICMLLDSFSHYVLVALIFFISLSHLGVNLGTLSLTAGVAGVIFSLGCQTTVADIISGILMLFDGMICVGDIVLYNNSPGIVHAVSVRTTKLKWFGKILVVRNNDLKNFVCKPESINDMVEVTLNIDVKESLEHIEEIFNMELPAVHEKMCGAAGESIRGPLYKGVKRISGDGMELSFVFFCKNPHSTALLLLLNRELKMICERYNIALFVPYAPLNASDQPK